MGKFVHMARVLFLMLLFSSAFLSPAAGQDLESEMQSSLLETRQTVSQLRQKLESGQTITKADHLRLKSREEQISARHLLLRERFEQREAKTSALGAKAASRHQEMAKLYIESTASIRQLLSAMASPEDVTLSILNELENLLKTLVQEKKRPVYGSLPYRSLGYPVYFPNNAAPITPAFMGGNMAVTEEDTAPAPEAPVSETIAALAESLHWNPIEIYEYVKNNIETQWYWGCMKGAEETLRQGSGNDCDQAALLLALLRASNYPARYVRGVVQFFPGLAKARNLTGLNDAGEIAAFFQKAGIPFEPVISAGKIVNFRIEHVWMETHIPYANYRGAVIDEHGKKWIAVDTSIKAAGYSQNTPVAILDDLVLNSFVQDYLQAPRSETPLDYLAYIAGQYLDQYQPGSTFTDTLRVRSHLPEYLGMVPASPQFEIIRVTGEYQSLPDDLLHTARFIARKDDNILFDVKFAAWRLSNRQVELTYEPETVEDQEIINSYGGLDSTPCYLVRLRPVIKMDGESLAVGKDGLPMGEDFELEINLISPHGTEEVVNNTQITGSRSVIGMVCGAVVHPQPMPDQDKDAARLLYEEALNYIDRWNVSEEILAGFLRLSVTRPIPTLVTLGSVIDVSYLLDTPHGFDWKGLYVDADLRAVECAGGHDFADPEVNAARLFKQLSALEGSALEGRLMKDDFGITSVSTSTLFALANTWGIPILAIDGDNISSVLPVLPFPDSIKEDISDSVNLGLTVKIPQTQISYEDWTGLGYVKEDPDTGDSGWMLSGMIAGGMTVLSPDNPEWEDYPAFQSPYTGPPNEDPNSAAMIDKIPVTNLQTATVGEFSDLPLQVLVRDKQFKPVKGVPVTFYVKAGGGTLWVDDVCANDMVTVNTDRHGIAEIACRAGLQTSANPAFTKRPGDLHATQVGVNVIEATLSSGTGLKTPFTLYGKPGEPAAMEKETKFDRVEKSILLFAGICGVGVKDSFGNPVSNVAVTFTADDPVSSSGCHNPADPKLRAKLVLPDDACLTGQVTYENCGTTGNIIILTDHTGASVASVIMGTAPDADYVIRAFSDVLVQSFTYHTRPVGECDPDTFPGRVFHYGYRFYSGSSGNNVTAGLPGALIPVRAHMQLIREIESENLNSVPCDGRTCDQITGINEYEVSTDFLPDLSSISFNGVSAASEGSGQYLINWLVQPGVNQIQVNYTGALKQRTSIPHLACDDCAIREETKTYHGTMTLTLYGVEAAFIDAQSNPLAEQLISVDADGFATCDTVLNYRITPAEYRAANAYVMIYRNDAPVSMLKAEVSGDGDVTIGRGFRFDLDAAYTAKVLLNNGAGEPMEMESAPLTLHPAPLDIAIEKILVQDPEINLPLTQGGQVTFEAITRPEGRPVTWSVAAADPEKDNPPISCKLDAETGLLAIDENSGSGWLTIQASDVEYPFIYKRAKIYVGCWTCGEASDCNGPAGNGFVQLSSVDVRLSLGKAAKGVPAGNIFLKSQIPAPNLATPKMLEFSSFVKDVESRYDEHGLRQVLAPKTFADIRIIDEFGFAVNFYDPAVVTGEAEGLYTFDSAAGPVASWKFENPDRTKDSLTRLAVTETKECGVSSYEYAWDADANGWILTRGDGLKIESATTEYTQDGWIETRTLKDGQGNIASKVKTTFVRFDWGRGAVKVVRDPDGAALATTYAYDDQGRIILQIDPAGSWTKYAYDGQGRIRTKITPWLDAASNASESQARAVYYDYTPADPSDSGLAKDMYKPRTITEKILGQIVSKTFYSYQSQPGGTRVEITEQCSRADAAFGDSASLRTTRIYYPAGTEAADSGKIKSIQYPDGRLDSYTYENISGSSSGSIFGGDQGSGALFETVVRGTMDHPAGIPFKTVKEITTRDEWGNPLMAETHVYTGAGYEKIGWVERLYDEDGRMIEEVRSDGTRTEKFWSFCHLLTETDRLGLTAGYDYDQLGRTISITRPGPAGNITTTFTYDAAGRRLSQTISAGGLSQATSSTYDTAGRLIRTIDASGLITTYAYADAYADAGLITTVTRPGGATEITERYLDGRVKHVYGTGTVEQYYEYGVNADGTRWTLACTGGQGAALWEKTTTDLPGRVVLTEKPCFDGTVAAARSFYNEKGQLIRTESPGQAGQLYVYDDLGEQVRSGLDVDGSASLEPASLDRISEADTSYVRIGTDWWRQSRQWVYANDNDDIATSTGISRNRISGLGTDGLVSESASIDLFGNQTVSKAYIDRGNRTETRIIDYPDSDTDAVSVGINGFLTSSTSATGITTAFQYDTLGRRTGTTDPRTGTSITHYDAQGRVDYVQDPAGNRITFTYDPATGRKTAETNPLGNTTRYAYNPQGQITHTWGDAAYPVRYQYDALGRMIAMHTYRTEEGWTGQTWPENASGDTTTWTYDPATGLLIAKTDAAGNATNYTYDTAGNLSTRTWARYDIEGNRLVTSYAYDPATGELSHIDYSDATPDITFAYDRLGRQTTVTDAAGSRNFTYNDHLQLESEQIIGMINRTITRNYEIGEVAGRASGFAAGDYSVSYRYDETGRMNQMGWNANAQSGTADYTYLPNADLLQSLNVDNDLSITYTYETHRNVRTRVQNTNGVQIISRYDYTYDAAGRRTSVINTGSAFAADAHSAYDYNNRHELIESTRYVGDNPADISQPVIPEYRAYQYDPIGNRESITEAENSGSYTTNSLNQYVQQTIPGDGARTFDYDADRNLTSLLENGSETIYSWNAENRLISVAPAAPVEGSTKLSFIYDYMGRRVKKTVYVYTGSTWQVEAEYLFIYDGWNLIEEITIAGGSETNRLFVWGLDLSQSRQSAGGIGGLIAIVDGSDSYLYCYDGNGNVGQLVNAANGAIAARYEYDPYGKPIKADGAYAGANPFRFSTKYHDDETGLVYYGYRYYAPELGRWLSEDPIEEDGGIGLYVFIGNDAINHVDVLGYIGRYSGPDGWRIFSKDLSSTTEDSSLSSEITDIFHGLEIRISSQVTLKYVIAAGPTPAPGIIWMVSANVKGETFTCLNKIGHVAEWGKVSVDITAEIIGGSAYKGLRKAYNSRGSRYRDSKGRFAKGPKSGDSKTPSETQISKISCCPEQCIKGEVEGFISGAAGIYWGGKAKLAFPIYPEFKKPEFDWSTGIGVVGVELKAGATGKVLITGPVGEVINLL